MSIIFFVSLAGIIGLIVWQIIHVRNNPDLLKKRSDWHIITSKTIHDDIVMPLQVWSQSCIKKSVYTGLGLYRALTHRLRMIVRSVITQILKNIDTQEQDMTKGQVPESSLANKMNQDDTIS
ncbi:MAG: hypothetical protein LRY46_02350 [Candidatus Pacebacteria bacterium]|nr:hypothetical protein [Candidatus Paceibacterota bacterium]